MYRNIILTGPESSGKTGLAVAMAEKLNCPLIKEYARTYLEKYGASYVFIDLLHIAKRQNFQQNKALSQHNMIISDTGNLVLYLWSQIKFGEIHPYIRKQFHDESSSLYVLCKPDIPWEYDTLRENPFDREKLYTLYKQTLIAFQKPFIEVFGSISERMEQVANHLSHLPD